jgi:uncharacterized protein (DUF433 family)
MTLPPLKHDKHGEYDELLPGFIVAHPRIQFGEPTLKGTRYTCSAGWLWDYLDRPAQLAKLGYTREQVIAASAFQAGREWQRSRARRKRIDDIVWKLSWLQPGS